MRRRVLAALVSLVCLGATACSGGGEEALDDPAATGATTAAPPATTAPGTTAAVGSQAPEEPWWQATLDDAADHGGVPTRAAALAAFGAVYGDLGDGVAVRAGRDGDEALSGSMVARWLAYYADDLPEAVRARVGARLWPDDPGAELVTVGGVDAGPGSALGVPRQLTEGDVLAAAHEYQTYFASQLGVRLPGRIHVRLLAADNPDDPDTAAFSNAALAGLVDLPDLAGLAGHDCLISVYPSLGRRSLGVQHAAIAHEVFHCYQHAMTPLSGRAFAAVPAWLVEGSAAWAGEQAVGGSSYSRLWWNVYLGGGEHARLRVTRTAYQAIGFYAQVAMASSDTGVYGGVRAAFESGESHDASLFQRVAAPGGFDFLTSFGSGVTRRNDLGPAWTMTGPGITEFHRPYELASASPGSPAEYTVPPMANGAVNIGMQGQVIDVTTSGSLRIRVVEEGPEATPTLAWQQRYCRLDRCVCPDGNPPIGGSGTTLPATANGLLAGLGGGAYDGASIRVVAHTLEELCDPTSTTVAPGPGRVHLDVVDPSGRVDYGSVDRTITSCQWTSMGEGPVLLVDGGLNEGEPVWWNMMAAGVPGETNEVVIQWIDPGSGVQLLSGMYTLGIAVAHPTVAAVTQGSGDLAFSGTFSGHVADATRIGPEWIDVPPPTMSGWFSCPAA